MTKEEMWDYLCKLSEEGRAEVFIDDGSWQGSMLADHVQHTQECDLEEEDDE